MRRCLAIGLAVLILALGARGVAAQDDGQSVSDRLLEILKQRQIISGDEYSELKGLASKMEADNAEMSRRLGDLDRSIADYLSKGEEDEYNRAHVAYRKGSGFQFATADGLFELNFGGFFLFNYTGWDMGRKSESGRYETGGKASPSSDSGVDNPRVDPNDFRFGDDTNNFALQENRIHLFGNAFMKELTYFVELDGAGRSESESMYSSSSPNQLESDYFYGYNTPREQSGVGLLEAWANYDHCGYFNLKFGQFKPPTDRNFLIHESDIAFPDRSYVCDLFSLQRDVGVEIWRMSEFKFNDQSMAYDASFGVFNGEGVGAAANDNTRLAYSGRATLYPMGYIDYVESDFACTPDPKLAFGGWYGNHKSDDYKPQYSNERIFSSLSTWGLDATGIWQGLYLTGEWIRRYTTIERRNFGPEGHYEMRNHGWFAQAGYYIKDYSLELLGRYGVSHLVDPAFDSLYYPSSTEGWANEITEITFGAAYYFSGHDWKVTLDVGQVQVDFHDGASDEVNNYVRLAFWLNW